MRIISRKMLTLFYPRHFAADIAMEEWYHKTKDAMWDNFAQMKKTFPAVDSVGNQRYVFNVRGSHYRIVAIVKFKMKTVYIRFVGTHEEYDDIVDIKNI